MNKKQLIITWISGILIGLLFFTNAESKGNEIQCLILSVEESIPIVIVAILLIYTLRNKKKELEQRTSYLDNKVQYLKEENVPQRLAHCSQNISTNPNSPDAYVERGIIYYQIDNEKAINDFTKAIEIDPYHDEAYINRAKVYVDIDKLDNAISDFTKAIEINPNFIEAYYDRALIYLYKIGDWEKAIVDFSKVITLDPLYMPQAYMNLSRAFKKTKRYYMAIEIYQEFMKHYENFSATVEDDKKKYLDMAKKDAAESIQFLYTLQDLTVFLEVLKGPMKGHKFFIKGSDDIILGNKLDLDISLCDDHLISSEHAKICINKNGYFIKDLDSIRGTYLNREKILESTVLTYGDLITLGETTLQFKVDSLKEKSRF